MRFNIVQRREESSRWTIRGLLNKWKWRYTWRRSQTSPAKHVTRILHQLQRTSSWLKQPYCRKYLLSLVWTSTKIEDNCHTHTCRAALCVLSSIRYRRWLPSRLRVKCPPEFYTCDIHPLVWSEFSNWERTSLAEFKLYHAMGYFVISAIYPFLYFSKSSSIRHMSILNVREKIIVRNTKGLAYAWSRSDNTTLESRIETQKVRYRTRIVGL